MSKSSWRVKKLRVHYVKIIYKSFGPKSTCDIFISHWDVLATLCQPEVREQEQANVLEGTLKLKQEILTDGQSER